jgi:MFS family permease
MDHIATQGRELSRFRTNAEIAGIGLGALMAALSQTLVIPVLPTIARDLDASTTQAQWLLTSTLLVAAAAVPVASRLADMFGRRLVLVLCLGSLAVGSLVDAVTSDATVMIVGRALTGLSGAAIPLGISLLATALPPERRGSAVALISAMLGIGGALGLPLAGLLADRVDYHVLYWIGAVGAVVAIAVIRAFVGESAREEDATIDVPGILLLAGGLVCLVLPLSQGTSWGWSSARVLGLFAASVVLLALLVVVERRTREPLVDLAAVSSPPVALTNVAALFVGFALFASFVGTANYVQAPKATGYGFGSDVLTAGLCLLPSGVMMLLLAPVAAKLIGRWGGGVVLAIGGVVIAIGLLERIVLVDSIWEVVLGSTIIGMGTGVGYASLPSLINSHTHPEALGAANGINTLARSLGSTLASAIGGSLLSAITLTLGGVEVPSLTAYRVLFAICAGAALLASIFGAVIASPWLSSRVPEIEPELDGRSSPPVGS